MLARATSNNTLNQQSNSLLSATGYNRADPCALAKSGTHALMPKVAHSTVKACLKHSYLLRVGAQTGAATVMVAERAAEILLADSVSTHDVRQPAELALA